MVLGEPTILVALIMENIDLIKLIIKTDRLLGREEGASEKLITYVADRAGHDKRYAIDSTKLKNELGWEPSLQFEEGIEKTVIWYLNNKEWLNNLISEIIGIMIKHIKFDLPLLISFLSHVL